MARSSRSSSSIPKAPLYVRHNKESCRESSKAEVEEDSPSSLPSSDDNEDGFFSLDVDLDLNSLDLNAVDEKCSKSAPPASWTLKSPTRLAPEPDALGNLEYKLRLLPPTRHRYDRLLTQLKWRLLQGGGYCTYEIGVLDDGRCVGICPIEMRASLRVLASLASELGAGLRVKKAFLLVESSKGNQLRSLNNKETQKVLFSSELPDYDRGDEQGSTSTCNCKLAEENLAWPEAKLLGKFLDSEAEDSSEVYEIDVEEEMAGVVEGESWLGACDDSDSDVEEMMEEVDEGVTYSLSLDEIATRQGIAYHRKQSKKKCRYQAKNAQLQRQKEAILSHKQRNGTLTTLKENDANASVTPAPPLCERIIVEALVSRIAETESLDFIDYAFL